MHNPLSQKELYEKLGKLSKQMDELDKTGETVLTSTHVETMQEIHPSVAVMSGQSMAQKLNTSCASCIKDALYVFSSVYNRLKREFEPEQMEPEEPVDYSDQLPIVEDQSEIQGIELNQSESILVPTPPEETPIDPDSIQMNTPESTSPKQAKAKAAKSKK